jgi:2-polyprenyl-6-methoxyphenol hydroxylase-like FAD-dependent oxidoreductase
VEIAGAGIGAMTAAAAFALRGWAVTVHETQPRLREAGAGIYVWENGFRVLEALGAYDDAIRDAHRGYKSRIRGPNNELMEERSHADERVYAVVRQNLVNALAKVATDNGATIVCGSTAVGALPEGKLLFSDGTSADADLVIGMDGVGSRVRDSLGLLRSLEMLPDGSIRAMIPTLPGEYDTEEGRIFIENWSGNRRLIITPINKDVTYLAFTCLDSDVEAKQVPIHKALWTRTFPHLAHYIDRVEDARWDVFSTIKVKAWSVGHVAIAGDAAHAQPPNLGQGGGMAMQNALGLAVALEGVTDRSDIPAALVAWETRERPLVEHCQKWSALYGELTYWPDELRLQVLHHGSQIPWITKQLTRAAQSHPTGTVGSTLVSPYLAAAPVLETAAD